MVVSQLRGITFRLLGNNYFPDGPHNKLMALEVLKEVALYFGFNETHKYLKKLNKVGRNILLTVKV